MEKRIKALYIKQQQQQQKKEHTSTIIKWAQDLKIQK